MSELTPTIVLTNLSPPTANLVPTISRANFCANVQKLVATISQTNLSSATHKLVATIVRTKLYDSTQKIVDTNSITKLYDCSQKLVCTNLKIAPTKLHDFVGNLVSTIVAVIFCVNHDKLTATIVQTNLCAERRGIMTGNQGSASAAAQAVGEGERGR